MVLLGLPRINRSGVEERRSTVVATKKRVPDVYRPRRPTHDVLRAGGEAEWAGRSRGGERVLRRDGSRATVAPVH